MMQQTPSTTRQDRRSVSTQCRIPATPQQVWSVLADLDRWSDWNPFIVDARVIAPAQAPSETGLRPKAQLELRMELDGMKPQVFKPTVLQADPGVAIRWLGRTGLPGIFDGEHRFLLEPHPEGGTLLHHEEHFRGLLARPLLAWMGPRLPRAFAAMNAALSRECTRRFG